jgi:hypothetical protein
VSDDQTPSILDIIDRQIAAKTAKRDDGVGKMVEAVLLAASPDGVMQHLCRQLLTGYISETRKVKITMLAAAFGADRKALKNYLRAHGLCGPVD